MRFVLQKPPHTWTWLEFKGEGVGGCRERRMLEERRRVRTASLRGKWEGGREGTKTDRVNCARERWSSSWGKMGRMVERGVLGWRQDSSPRKENLVSPAQSSSPLFLSVRLEDLWRCPLHLSIHISDKLFFHRVRSHRHFPTNSQRPHSWDLILKARPRTCCNYSQAENRELRISL